MEEAKPSKLDKFLDFIPGFLTWVVLTSPVWLGILSPNLVALFLTFLAIYWVYLAFAHTIGLVIGYRLYKHETSLDWWGKCKELKFSELPDKPTLPENLEEVKHFILIPTVNEPFEVLDGTLGSIAAQSYGLKDNLFVTISCEERGATDVEQSVARLREKYKDQIGTIMFFVHPFGLPGELIGGGAPNRTWGARHTVEELEKRGENLKNFIFTTFDADTNIHKEFISRLTHAYLVSDKRFNHFYSTAVFLFNNNIWDVHTLMRIEATSVTLGTLSTWTLPNWTIGGDAIETFSCYSAALDTLIAANYWDVRLIDDTVFYWRAFFARNGDFKPVIFYTPNSSDAVHAGTFVNAHKSLYKQLIRWGWGSVTTPLAIKGFIENKSIPLNTKILWMYNKVQRHMILRTMVFLITFGFAILTLVNQHVRQTTIAYRLPQIMSTILNFGLIFIVPSIILRLKILKPMPKRWSIFRKMLAVMEGPLVIVNLLTFSFLPFLQAETLMMLGKRYKNLHYTPKYR